LANGRRSEQCQDNARFVKALGCSKLVGFSVVLLVAYFAFPEPVEHRRIWKGRS